MVFANWAVGAIAVAVVRLSPPHLAYALYWQVYRFFFAPLAPVYRRFNLGSEHAQWRILMLQRALTAMTRKRPGFDLQVKVLGKEVIEEELATGKPIVIFTAHFGLTLAAPRVLADLGRPPAFIARLSTKSDGWNWGLKTPLQILGDDAYAFVRARRAMKNGTPIICYVDYYASDDGSHCPNYYDGSHRPRRVFISPHAFQFAHRLSAQVLFLASSLEADGAIIIEFSRANRGQLRSSKDADLCAAEFASFVAKRTGWDCCVRSLNAPPVEEKSPPS
jgi:hypothetical protein